MNLPKVAVLRKMFDEHHQALSGFCQPHLNETDAILTPAQIINHAQKASGIVSFVSDALTAEVIDALPSLKVIANVAVGYSNINLAACRARGIIVTNTPDVLTKTTAELGLALLFASMRRLSEAQSWLRAGQWQGWAFVNGWERIYRAQPWVFWGWDALVRKLPNAPLP